MFHYILIRHLLLFLFLLNYKYQFDLFLNQILYQMYMDLINYHFDFLFLNFDENVHLDYFLYYLNILYIVFLYYFVINLFLLHLMDEILYKLLCYLNDCLIEIIDLNEIMLINFLKKILYFHFFHLNFLLINLLNLLMEEYFFLINFEILFLLMFWFSYSVFYI